MDAHDAIDIADGTALKAISPCLEFGKPLAYRLVICRGEEGVAEDVIDVEDDVFSAWSRAVLRIESDGKPDWPERFLVQEAERETRMISEVRATLRRAGHHAAADAPIVEYTVNMGGEAYFFSTEQPWTICTPETALSEILNISLFIMGEVLDPIEPPR